MIGFVPFWNLFSWSNAYFAHHLFTVLKMASIFQALIERNQFSQKKAILCVDVIGKGILKGAAHFLCASLFSFPCLLSSRLSSTPLRMQGKKWGQRNQRESYLYIGMFLTTWGSLQSIISGVMLLKFGYLRNS